MATSEYGQRERRSALEHLICQLSAQTPDPSAIGGGGVPEMTTSDYAATAAGYRHPVGEHLVGVRLFHGPSVSLAAEQLDIRGWLRWRERHPKIQITPEKHANMVSTALIEYQQRVGFQIGTIRNMLGANGERWQKIMPHYLWLVRTLYDCENELSEHLERQRREEAA